jgi:hypothetical protein
MNSLQTNQQHLMLLVCFDLYIIQYPWQHSQIFQLCKENGIVSLKHLDISRHNGFMLMLG